MRRDCKLIKSAVGGSVLALVAIAAMALLIAPPVGANFPGHNGRIAFMRADANGFWQTWVASADLTSQVKLTSESANSGWPVWSPDGAKLAFDSDRADPDPSDSEVINDVYTVNPDGSGVVNLTGSAGFSGDPGWSPDGSQIAFDSDRNAAKLHIYVMNADGTNPHRITTLPPDLPPQAQGDAAPRFSPDGTRLVFTRYRGDQDANSGDESAVYTIGVDGSGLRRLTPWKMSAGDADFSPDGTQLVFEANPKVRFGEIYVVDADGRHLHNVTHNGQHGGSADPVWAPDGTKILFLDTGVFDGTFTSGLATMNPDGSARTFLSPTPMVEHQPDWESIP
jgi:Tol biopolymer transport system component